MCIAEIGYSIVSRMLKGYFASPLKMNSSLKMVLF